jgi:hypothetical protein
MDKKKKVSDRKSPESIKDPPKHEVPAMVTEVVSEDDLEQEDKPILEDLLDQKAADETEKPVDEEAHSHHDHHHHSHPEHHIHEAQSETDEDTDAEEDEELPQLTPTEKSKEVVQELFSRPNGGEVTEISISRRKSGKTLFLWSVVVIVAAITTGLGLIVFSGNADTVGFLAAAPTPTPTASPTPTPMPVPKREDAQIRVLNGGGVGGAATKMKDFLTKLGYKVADVGNTEEYTYEETEVSVKTGSDSLADLLQKDLEAEYTVGKTDTQLPADSKYDAVVIVGKE